MKNLFRHMAVASAVTLSGMVLSGTAIAGPGKNQVVTHQVYVSPQIYSQTHMPAGQATHQQLAQRKISYAEAKSIARRHYPEAQILDIVLRGKFYRVRLQRLNGVVKDLKIDATTGRIPE